MDALGTKKPKKENKSEDTTQRDNDNKTVTTSGPMRLRLLGRTVGVLCLSVTGAEGTDLIVDICVNGSSAQAFMVRNGCDLTVTIYV